MDNALKSFDFIFRVIVLLLSTTLVIVFTMAGARTALAATIKPVSIVEGTGLTAGDVFAGLPADKANRVLGQPPLPGQDLVLNAHMLLRIATALDLDWRPASAAEQVIIRRAATIINNETITDIIKSGLRDKGVEGRFNISFTSGVPQMVLPQNEPAQAEIMTLDFNPQYDRFDAVIVAPSLENPLSRITVSGVTERIVSVPVLKNNMQNGDIINAYDLDWVDVAAKDIQHDIILNEEDMIGMTPRRMATAGKPIRAKELQAPQLVSRGDNVTIILQNNKMTLTTHGKALQNGAKGDMIRVVNTGSNRSIEAFVTGDQVVSVTHIQ